MKTKTFDILGQITVIIAILLLAPVLIPIGGILLMFRYYCYVRDIVNNKVPKKYYF